MGKTWQGAAAELVATFALVFVGAGSVLLAGPTGGGPVAVALAHGLVLAVMVSVTAHLSGGHVNPAVTLAVWATGAVTTLRAIVYVAAQLVGAALGAVLLRLAVPGDLWAAASGGTPGVNTGAGMTVGKAVLLEAILTFFLVFAYVGTVVDRRGPLARTAGLTVGLVLAADLLVGGQLTGAAVNPARALGPALVSATWTDWWVYWIGPIAGGLVGAFVYWGTFLRRGEDAGIDG